MAVLHYPAQLRSRAALEAQLGQRQGSEEERLLAGQLIDSSSGPVDWQKYRDDTAEKIHALVEAKIEGRPLDAQAEEPQQVLQLLDVLKKSVAATRTSGPADGSKPPAARKSNRRRIA